MSFAEDYVDVATRISLFRDKYPEGSLQPVDPAEPVKVMTVGDKTYLQYVAAAYRNADDQRPGIGIAWEIFPGRTPYTRDSEAMVVETSAWGRAIVAALAADTKKGVASADEVRSAQSRREAPAVTLDELLLDVSGANTLEALGSVARRAQSAADAGQLPQAALTAVKKAYEKRKTELTPASEGDAA